MPVSTTFDLDVAALLAELPTQNTTGITATSSGVNTVNLQTWLDRASGQIHSLLVRQGIDPLTLSDDEITSIQAGIIAYVSVKTLQKLQRYEQARDLMPEWESVLTMLRERPEDLGASGDVASLVASNVDPDNPSPDFWGRGFSGF